MGLEVVVNEIIEQGRRQAADIEREGLEEQKAILEEAKAKAEANLEEKRNQAQRDAERIRIQEVARAEFEAKRNVLVAKRELWDRLHEEALEALGSLPEDVRAKHLKTLIARAKTEIPSGTVHVRPADTGLVSGSGYAVEGDLDAVGGLVVEDDEGTVSIDFRFESLLADAWPAILKSESNQLFG